MLRRFLLIGGQFATGLAIKKFFEFAFDYGLYPFVLVYLGYLGGGVAMTAITFLLNVFLIRAYDWSETDWLLIEKIKHVKEDDTVMLPRLFSWMRPLLKKGDLAAFFVLCIDDPVTATLYLRKGSYQYNGLTERDWFIFVAANVVANLYWIIGLAGIIELVRVAFQN